MAVVAASVTSVHFKDDMSIMPVVLYVNNPGRNLGVCRYAQEIDV